MEALSIPGGRVEARTRLESLSAVLTGVIVGVAGMLYGVFIAQSAFRVDGRLAFSLFDDAMISMTYARNLADGSGLVWNAGEAPVEGYTNFLWTVWLAVLHLPPLADIHVSLLVMASGVALLVADALVVRAIAVRLAPETWWVAPLATALVALYYPIAYWTLRGMEVGLLAFLVSSAVLLALRLEARVTRRDAVLLGAVLAAGVLTRTDFLLAAGVVVAYLVLSRRRVALALGAVFVGTLAAHTAFRLAYYGAPLPNTYYLKLEGASVGTRAARGWLALQVTVLLHLYAPVLIAVAGTASALLQRKRINRPLLLLAAIVFAQAAYSVYVGGDAWEWFQYSNRYVSTVVPLVLLGAALGLRELVRVPRTLVWPLAGTFAGLAMMTDKRPLNVTLISPMQVGAYRPMQALFLCAGAALLLAHPRLRPLGVAALAALVLVAPNLEPVRDWRGRGAWHVRDDADMARYGLAIRANTDRRARVAVVWAGAIPYFARRSSVDLLGKSDRVIAHRPPRRSFYPGHSKWDIRYSLGTLRPDLVAQVVDPPATRRAGYYSLFNQPSVGLVAAFRNDSYLIDRQGLRSYLLDAAKPS